MTQGRLFEPILNLIVETMPRDNLLNSAALEFFDFIKRENMKTVISHLVENYRDKLKEITYVDIFHNFILRYEQTQGFASESSFLDTEEDTPRRPETGRGNRWDTGVKDLDAQEEEYFNTSDNEDEDDGSGKGQPIRNSINGASPLSKPLVDYPSDEESENMETDISAGIFDEVSENTENTPPRAVKGAEVRIAARPISPVVPSPPEKLSEKRRREEEDEDEMSKLSQPKRRNSTSSAASNTSSVLRRKKSFNSSPHGNGSSGKTNKIAISLSPAIKTGGEGTGGEDGGN